MHKRIVILTGIIFLWFCGMKGEPASKPKKMGWDNDLVTGLNINQVSFQNWQKGGDNSYAWAGRINGKFEKIDSTYNFNTNFKLKFGQTKIEDQEFRKSIDEIKLESVFIKKLGMYVNPYLSVNLETQIAPGYQYSENSRERVSRFFDPGYITEGIGMGIEAFGTWKSRLGFAIKQTFTRKFPVPYADDPKTSKTEQIKIEPGAQFASEFNWKINENTLFNSKLESFSNMKHVREIDIKIDNGLVSKISKYFNISFEYDILYDYDQSKKVQIKQSFAFGVQYTIF